MKKVEIIIKDTHRALWYEDGVLAKVLEAGRYEIPKRKRFFGRKGTLVEITLVDMRERDLTIKGQEILTSDKVALRVSIIVQFRVVDPKLAIHAVEKYEDRLYSDVQLAARRSLASTTLEEILTNRNRLSEDNPKPRRKRSGRRRKAARTPNDWPPRATPRSSVFRPRQKFAGCRSGSVLLKPTQNTLRCCGCWNSKRSVNWPETGMREFTSGSKSTRYYKRTAKRAKYPLMDSCRSRKGVARRVYISP